MVLGAAPAVALTLEFPGPAQPSANRQEAPTSFDMPIGPWRADGVAKKRLEGALDQTAWRIDTPGLTTLAILNPLKAQLLADGWTVLYECEARDCGGFGFRFEADILPEPEMHVDLGDFRYLAAEREGPKGMEYVSLIASRSTSAGFVQVTQIGSRTPPPPKVVTGAPPEGLATPARPVVPVGDVIGRLESTGSVVLEDLIFPPGAATLAEGDYASLRDLAAYLRDNPERTIALVGHTDASGGLDANIALSKRRATSVREMLIGKYGAPAPRIAAEGVGFLAPRASNLTPEGRTENRRVEVMITSTR